MEVEEWSLGHVYSVYYDHWETQELISILRSGGNIVTAVATLIIAIAALCGIPLDINITTANAGNKTDYPTPADGIKIRRLTHRLKSAI